MDQEPEFTVVYIMGRGRSGSTVLDLMLDNHEKIQAVGELATGFGFRSKVARCACQALPNECDFWGNIRKRLQQLHPETSLDQYSKMVNYMARFYRILQIKTGIGTPAWLSTYDSMTYDLYALIARKSHRSYIVDSSKDIGHAYYLLKRLPAKIKIIHLVRDGRGVMWSRLRQLRAGIPFQFLRRYYTPKRHWTFMILTVLSWNVANMMGLLLRLLHNNQIIQVKYEDICRNPTQELIRIGGFLNLDLTPLKTKIENSEPFNIGHSIAGNPMRYSSSGNFTFKPDYAWRKQLPRGYKLLFVLLAFPLALYYGYLHKP